LSNNLVFLGPFLFFFFFFFFFFNIRTYSYDLGVIAGVILVFLGALTQKMRSVVIEVMSITIDESIHLISLYMHFGTSAGLLSCLPLWLGVDRKGDEEDLYY